MEIRILLFIALLSMSMSSFSQAKDSTPSYFGAEQILKHCKSGSPKGQDICFLFLGTIADAQNVYLNPTNLSFRLICFPSSIPKLHKLREVYIKYSNNYSGNLEDVDAASLAVAAFAQEFPCRLHQ